MPGIWQHLATSGNIWQNDDTTCKTFVWTNNFLLLAPASRTAAAARPLTVVRSSRNTQPVQVPDPPDSFS